MLSLEALAHLPQISSHDGSELFPLPEKYLGVGLPLQLKFQGRKMVSKFELKEMLDGRLVARNNGMPWSAR